MTANTRIGRSLEGLVTLLLLLALEGTAHAAGEAQVLRLKGEQLAAQDRCAEALPALREARRLDPNDAGAALLEGQCAIREGSYADAVAALEQARQLDPRLSEATGFLGVAHYHLGNFDRAAEELKEAEQGLPPDSPALAQVYLYRGLVLLDRADAAQAAADLERASSLAPQLVDPAATYFAGRAWQAAADRERAELALRRVIEQAPGTVWAREAELALESRFRKRRAWGRVFGGMEYDSNVRLRGQGVFLVPGQGGEGDGRGFWGLDAGTELFRNQNWAGGVAASYYGNAQIELNDFDVQFPTGFAWLDRAIGEASFARLQLDAGYGWVGYDPYLFPLTMTLSGHHAFEKAGSGRAYFQYGYRDYRYTINTFDAPPTIPPGGVKNARNRDGNWYQGGYDHAYPWRRALLQGGVAGGRYDSHREYTHSSFLVWLGAQVSLPWDSFLDAGGSYTGEWYDNPSTFRDPVTGAFPTKDRQDNLWLARVAIEKRVTDWLSITARYLYANSDSNTKVYDYDRHIIGGYFTIWLGEHQERRTWNDWRTTL